MTQGCGSRNKGGGERGGGDGEEMGVCVCGVLWCGVCGVDERGGGG